MATRSRFLGVFAPLSQVDVWLAGSHGVSAWGLDLLLSLRSAKSTRKCKWVLQVGMILGWQLPQILGNPDDCFSDSAVTDLMRDVSSCGCRIVNLF